MSAIGFSDLCGDLLSGGTAIRFRASGSSMAPAIRDGDQLTVEPVGQRPFADGDVVLYPAGARFRAHRVRSFDPLRSELVCEGDAWFCRREVVPAASVVGVVIGIGPEATPVPPKRKAAAWWAEFRGRLGRLIRAAHRHLDSGGQSC